MNSIEEKAKAYDEALERAKKWYNAPNVDKIPTFGNIVIDEIFPELKESEDERILKQLRDFFKNHINSVYEEIDDNNDVLTWLEKQGECEFDCPQNHQDVNRPNGCIVLEDFNGGEGFYKVHLDYLNKKQVEEIEEMIRVWNNKELKTPNENIKDCIGICLTDADEQRFKDFNTNLKECLVWLKKQGEQKLPIEKLPSEMKTIGESLGFTTQEDCDIYNKMVTDLIMSDDGKGEQKPANKAEPKFKIGDNIEPIDSCLGSPRTIYKICDGFYETNQGTLDFEFENNWRLVEQKPATWGEEDESMLNFVKVVLNKHKNDAFFDKFETTLNDCLTWFRNIKSRVGCEVNCTTKQQWKPSDEHYELEEFAKIIRCNLTGISKAVQALFEAKYLQLTGNKMYGGFKD